MNSSTDIRNQVIDQLMAINDKDFFLTSLSKMIDGANVEALSVALTEEQKLMLAMSEADIAADRTIEQQVLHERELRWLKGK